MDIQEHINKETRSKLQGELSALFVSLEKKCGYGNIFVVFEGDDRKISVELIFMKLKAAMLDRFLPARLEEANKLCWEKLNEKKGKK